MIEQASLVIGEGNWAVKSDSLLGYKINGGKYYPREMSVVRATTGTRINEDGLVELVPYNLAQYSEDFSNAAWLKAQTTITVNATTAPNGKTTANKVLATATNGQHGCYNASPYASNFIGEVYTYSVYAKKGTVDWLVLDHYQGANTFTWFNLNTGTLGTVASGVTATIENVGDGWYRCSCTKAITSTSSNYVGYYLSNANNTFSFNASGTESVYLWGAQVNVGSSALDYLPTTDRLDVARIDYSSGSGALLVEPQRTNIALYSEDIAQTLPTNGGGTITANNTTAPNGVQSADKFTVDTSTGTHYFYNSYTITNGQSYTTSIFLKKGTGRYFLYRILTNNNSDRFGVTIDLETGTILSTNSLGTPTGTSSKIEDYGNGWYRVSLSINGLGTLLATLLETSNTGTPTLDAYLDYSYTGNGTDTYYLWGMQIEAGAYPTSLIQTQAATVTRNADVISKTGIADLIGQTEGTLYVDYNYEAKPDTNGNIPMVIYDGSNEAYIFITGFGSVRLELYNGGVLQCSLTTSIGAVGRKKIAFGYKQNDFVGYMNGVQIATDTSGTVGAMSNLYVGSYYTASYNANGGINAAALWKTRLTNAELATLTTI